MPRVAGRIREPIVLLNLEDGLVRVRVDDARNPAFWMEVTFTAAELEEYLAALRRPLTGDDYAEGKSQTENHTHTAGSTEGTGAGSGTANLTTRQPANPVPGAGD